MKLASVAVAAVAAAVSSVGFSAVLGSYTAENVSASGAISATMPLQAGTEAAGVDLTSMSVGNVARRTGGHSVDSFSISWGGARNESLAFAIANNFYFQFTLTPEATQQVALSSFNFKMFLPERSSPVLGGTNVFWFQPEFSLFSSATDDGDGQYEAVECIATRLFTTPELTTSASNYNGSFDLSGIAALQDIETAVTFRIYVHNTIARATYTSPTNTTFTRANGYEPIGIGQDDITNQTDAFVVNGEVSPIPEPSAVGLLALSTAGLLLNRRKAR